jgi:hypothetical protein
MKKVKRFSMKDKEERQMFFFTKLAILDVKIEKNKKIIARCKELENVQSRNAICFSEKLERLR